MKKLMITLLFASIIANMSCKKNDTVTASGNCSQGAANEYLAAINAWQSDITNKSKCQTVLAASTKFLNCPGVTAAEKKQYQDLVDSKPCD